MKLKNFELHMDLRIQVPVLLALDGVSLLSLSPHMDLSFFVESRSFVCLQLWGLIMILYAAIFLRFSSICEPLFCMFFHMYSVVFIQWQYLVYLLQSLFVHIVNGWIGLNGAMIFCNLLNFLRLVFLPLFLLLIVFEFSFSLISCYLIFFSFLLLMGAERGPRYLKKNDN